MWHAQHIRWFNRLVLLLIVTEPIGICLVWDGAIKTVIQICSTCIFLWRKFIICIRGCPEASRRLLVVIVRSGTILLPLLTALLHHRIDRFLCYRIKQGIARLLPSRSPVLLVKILRLIFICVQIWPDHYFITIVVIRSCIVVFLIVCKLLIENGLEVTIGSFCLFLDNLNELFDPCVELRISLISQLEGRAY